MNRRYLVLFLTIAIVALLGAGVVIFSARSPVVVNFVSESLDYPLDIAISQPAMTLLPGETQRVIYRVTNPDDEAHNVIADLEYGPANGEFQVRIFQTDCGQWTMINPGETVEFETVFSVLPAGPFGQDEITLRHVFKKP